MEEGQTISVEGAWKTLLFIVWRTAREPIVLWLCSNLFIECLLGVKIHAWKMHNHSVPIHLILSTATPIFFFFLFTGTFHPERPDQVYNPDRLPGTIILVILPKYFHEHLLYLQMLVCCISQHTSFSSVLESFPGLIQSLAVGSHILMLSKLITSWFLSSSALLGSEVHPSHWG